MQQCLSLQEVHGCWLPVTEGGGTLEEEATGVCANTARSSAVNPQLLKSSVAKAAGSSEEQVTGDHGGTFHLARTYSFCPSSLSLAVSRCLS